VWCTGRAVGVAQWDRAIYWLEPPCRFDQIERVRRALIYN